jgi:hypothetical protein
MYSSTQGERDLNMGDLRESEPKESSLQVDVGCDLMRELIKKSSNATTGMRCWRVSWGGGRGGCRDDVRDNTTTKGSAPHRKEDPETRTGLISTQACVQRQLSLEGD